MMELVVYSQAGKQLGRLELTPGTTLALERTSPYFDENLSAGTFSYPLDVPFSDNNRKVLGAPEMFETIQASGQPLPWWIIDAIEDGTPVITRGKLTMIGHKGTFDYTRGNYTMTVSGEESLYGALVTGKKLSQLYLGGSINTNAGDGRAFAAAVALGMVPQSAYLAYASIYWPEYIDESREDFTTEFVAGDIVNNIVINSAFGGTKWKFGRPDPLNSSKVLSSGSAGYQDYRSIPFFKLAYVLRSVFTEHGFTPYGAILSDVDFNKLYLFNNCATEIYNSISQDVNRIIYPRNHMPDVTIGEFLAAIGQALNLAFIFLPGNKVNIARRDEPILVRSAVNMSNRTVSTYDATRTAIALNGVKIGWGWDSNDGMVGDRIKEVDAAKVRGNSDTFSNISSNISSPVDGDLVYVINENYYYIYTQYGNWVFYSEGQQAKVIGDGQQSLEPQVSTLCHLINYQLENGSYLTDILGIRQNGSYYNNLKAFVSTPASVRIFYIDYFTVGVATGVPMAFTHALNPLTGASRVSAGLSFSAPNGVYPFWHKRWIEAQVKGWSTKVKFFMSAGESQILQFSQKVQIGAIQCLVQKVMPVLGSNAEEVEAQIMVI